MRVSIDYGRRRAQLEIADSALVPSRSAEPLASLADPSAALLAALEQPIGFPSLRRALTPDDRITVAVDERLPGLAGLVVTLLEYLLSAGIQAEAITLLCAPPSTGQPWLEELPEALEEVHCEVHDPSDRRQLSYVASASKGRPLLISRSAVDAAQLVVLTGRRYDPLLGHGGGAGALYPVLGDRATRAQASKRLSPDVPSNRPASMMAEAEEAVWLLGLPFFVQVLEGAGDAVAQIIGGPAATLDEGQRRLDALWRRVVPRQADVVIASLSGDPARHSFADFAAALACAARVVRPEGSIVLLSEATPPENAISNLLRGSASPENAVREYIRREDLDLIPGWQWAFAASRGKLYMLTGLAEVKNLFAAPLENIEQVQEIVSRGESCLVLPDAHKSLAVVEAMP